VKLSVWAHLAIVFVFMGAAQTLNYLFSFQRFLDARFTQLQKQEQHWAACSNMTPSLKREEEEKKKKVVPLVQKSRPVQVKQEGDGQCISLLGGVFFCSQNWTIPFGLM